jgi:predicted branched-subunit amino acid permease
LIRQHVLTGIYDALRLPAWVVGLTMLGVGSLARDVGHPAAAAVLSTLLIWAGPAQVILYGGLATGVALPALAVAVSLSSIRFLPMTMSVLPQLRRPKQSLGLQLLFAHYVAVTVWVQTHTRIRAIPEEGRIAYYLGFANATLLVSSFMTFLGYFMAAVLPLPLAAALLFVTPVFFTLSLIAATRSAMDATAMVLGFVLAPAFASTLGRDFDLLATGLIGGTAAYCVGRATRR